jgi:hypothetical protein
MNYLNHEYHAGPYDLIEVTLDHAANVQLMDGANYENYRGGRPYHYHGGYIQSSSCALQPPSQNHWHLVIDLGGYPGAVRASVRMISSVAS